MRVVKQLPTRLRNVEQAGAKFANIYAAMAKLEVGSAVQVEMADAQAETFEDLVKRCHSCQGTWHVRKNSVERFACRKDAETQTVFIVRTS